MKKQNLVLLLALLVTIGLVGCSGRETGPADGKPKSGTPADTSKSTVSTAETPSQVTKSFLEAERGRRYGEIRDMLSQRSLTNLTDAANRAGTNLDQALKRVIDQDAQDMAASNFTAFETRNEEIRGDHATVEAKATNAPQFARISLTKEGDRWKINIDETAPVGDQQTAPANP